MGLTQAQMAKRLGITRDHYARVERGQCSIQTGQALELARFFGALRIRRGDHIYIVRPDGTVKSDGSDDDPDGGGGHSLEAATSADDDEEESTEGLVLQASHACRQVTETVEQLPAYLPGFARGQAPDFASEMWTRLRRARAATATAETRLARLYQPADLARAA